jgi:hypothetical protein
MIENTERTRLRLGALSRWENEGGAGTGALPVRDSGSESSDEALSGGTESVQLRIRVIALENLVISLLAQAPDTQGALAREMATYISPRPGYTPHHLTLRAADEMRSLVDRATRFRTSPTI